MKEKIGALAITALMLMVAVPAVSASPVSADPSTFSAGPFKEAREEYKAAREAFQKAHAAWLTAKADFITAKAAWSADRTDPTLRTNAVEAHRTALLAAENMMTKRLEALKVRVDGTRGLSDNEKPGIITEIDNWLSWLQDKQTEIQNAENGQVLRSIAKEIRSTWRVDIRVRIKQIVGQILSAWVDSIVQKGEAFAGRIEAKIEELKDNGEDTSQLESWLSDYNVKLSQAEAKYDAAKDKFEEISDENNVGQLFREGIALIKEGNQLLKEAFRALKDIISDMRDKGHTVTLSGSGTLIAQGDGKAYLSGTGTVDVKATIQGTMLVSPGAEVTATGTGTENTLDNGWVQYSGYGSATVTGTEITVDIEGDGIDIQASGTGTVTLTGTGTYSTYGQDNYLGGSWTTAGVALSLSTGETTTGAT